MKPYLLISLFVFSASLFTHAQIRINEVSTTSAFEDVSKWFELKNEGSSAVDVSNLWVCIEPSYIQLNGLNLLSGSLTIQPGEFAVFEWATLKDDVGELGLYNASSFGNPSAILDYIQYGGNGSGRDDVAGQAGIWTDGAFVEPIGNGQTYSFFSDEDDDPVNNWTSGDPTPGQENVEAVNTDVEDQTGSIPSNFQILSNFPNPFNPSTAIRFSLAEPASVRIDVFNMLGQKVLSLPPRRFGVSASNQFSLNASTLSSGVYFYRLTAQMQSQTVIQTSKFTLIK